MKRVYIISSILLLASCINNPQRENAVIEEDVVVAQAALDSNLVRGVLKLVEHQNYLQFPEIPIDESFIIMSFLEIPRKNSLDSIVTISHFHYFFCVNREEIKYRGMLNIKGYNIAIFDPNDFGHNFFYIDSLQQTPLDNFQRFPAKNVISEQFRVHNGLLEYRGAFYSISDPDTFGKGGII